MINISQRLNFLASFIKNGETMADIGTDHGYLPIFLTIEGTCPHVILTDISEGPLEIARKNAEELVPEQTLDFRLADGMTCLKNGEVNAVVMAGMGGILISEMLDKDIEKSRSFDRYIFQPRNNAAVLRQWLDMHDFIITTDSVVLEGSHYCEVIVASPMGKESKEEFKKAREVAFAEEMMPASQEILYEIPLLWVVDNTPLITEYLKEKMMKETEIIDAILKNSSGSLSEKVLQNSIKKKNYILFLFSYIMEMQVPIIKNDRNYEIN